MSAWKQFERDAADLFQGKRFWANSGERVDFQGEIPFPLKGGCIIGCPHSVGSRQPVKVHGQCKLVGKLSLERLTQLAEEPGVDVVCVKVRRGAGKPSPALVVMTFENYKRLHG